MKQRYYHTVLIFTVVLLIAFGGKLIGQVQYDGNPAAIEHRLGHQEVPIRVLALSPEKELTRKQLSGVDIPGEPLHAGFVLEAGISPLRQGRWEVVNGDLHVWRIRLVVPQALGIGLNFDAFHLNENARLFVYDPDQNMVLGAFDHRNNSENQVFSTHIVPGQEIIVEYQEPWYPGKSQVLINTLFNIESVIYLSYGGALELFTPTKNLGDAGDCQVNINCPEGTFWQDEKRGIARMLMRVGTNYFWCTGTLINNTSLDFTPYFLSAEHCGRNASPLDLMYWQFYFNYERPGCENQGTPPYNMMVGALHKALGPLNGGSDFRLVELSETPPAHWRPYWNGWDRSATISNSGVGIHHPAGDAMKISTYELALVNSAPVVSGQPMAPNSAWQVRWSATTSGHGVSEGGSSGSPLFNNNGLVIGTLSGGSSSCDNLFAPDYYGKFSHHWNLNGPQPNQRLAGFLDPLQTNQLTLQGLDSFIEELTPPGFLSATTNQNQVTLSWRPPGSFPNTQGWYGHIESLSHLTWAGPERATLFDAPDLGLSYPLTLSQVSHMFVESTSLPWPNDQFTFKIYASDASTLLYQSPQLTAVSRQEVDHELSEPLVFNDFFYVAVRPVDASGHPSTWMRLVNLGRGFSFYGSPQNWIPHHNRVAPYNVYDDSFTYSTFIYVDPLQQKAQPGGTPAQPIAGKAVQEKYEEEWQVQEVNFQQPDAYRLYRDDELIFTTGPEMEMAYTETLPTAGLYRYHVTALYNGSNSPPSNNAYVLIADPCPQTLATWPYVENFNAGFDDTCWITHNENEESWVLNETFSWNQTVINPSIGSRFYRVHAQGAEITDSWLITPVIDFSGLNNPALRFAFNSVLLNQDDQFAVWVSIDGQSFVRVWESTQHPQFSLGNSPQWLQATINLRNLSNLSNVRIGFQFVGQENAYAAVDNIRISSAQLYTLTLNVTPEDKGMVSGRGQYMEGETVTVVADPNVTQVFDAWLLGTNVVSNQEVYQFQMPASNLTLTARFMGDPTDIDVITQGHNLALAFPNPTQGNIRLRFNEYLHDTMIILMNAQGQMIQQLQLQDSYPGGEQEMIMQHLPQGMYFIHIQSDKGRQLIKVIRSQ